MDQEEYLSNLLQIQADCLHEDAWHSFSDLSELESCLEVASRESTLVVLLTIVRNIADKGGLEALGGRAFKKLCLSSVSPPAWEDLNRISITACCSLVNCITSPRLSKGRATELISRAEIPAHLVSSALQGSVDNHSLVRLIQLMMESSSDNCDKILAGFRHLITGCKLLFESEACKSIEGSRGDLLDVVENGLSAFCSVASLTEMHMLKSRLICIVPELMRILAEETTLQRMPSVLVLLYVLLDISGDDSVLVSDKLATSGFAVKVCIHALLQLILVFITKLFL